MSYRFDEPLIASAYHFGDRGLGVLGSEIASTGTHGPGYVFDDLSLPADANKEYRGYVITPPGAGTFFAFEDTSFLYSGPSTSFTYRLYEDGVDLGTQTVTIEMVAPSASLNWVEDSDVFVAYVSATDKTTVNVGWVEAEDTHSLSTSVLVATTIGWTEADDVLSVSVTHTAQSANLNWVEDSDSTNLATIVSALASASWTEPEDISNLSVSIANAPSLAISWTEEHDTINIQASIARVLSMAWAEASDISSVQVFAEVGIEPLPERLTVKFINPKYKITFSKGWQCS